MIIWYSAQLRLIQPVINFRNNTLKTHRHYFSLKPSYGTKLKKSTVIDVSKFNLHAKYCVTLLWPRFSHVCPSMCLCSVCNVVDTLKQSWYKHWKLLQASWSNLMKAHSPSKAEIEHNSVFLSTNFYVLLITHNLWKIKGWKVV